MVGALCHSEAALGSLTPHDGVSAGVLHLPAAPQSHSLELHLVSPPVCLQFADQPLKLRLSNLITAHRADTDGDLQQCI